MMVILCLALQWGKQERGGEGEADPSEPHSPSAFEMSASHKWEATATDLVPLPQKPQAK